MRVSFMVALLGLVGTAHAATDLKVAIDNVRTNCAGISSELSDLKKMAGINTAVTAVGTFAGGVALGTGVAKANVDKEISELEKKLKEKAEAEEEDGGVIKGLSTTTMDWYEQRLATLTKGGIEAPDLEKMVQKSKTLGHIRTGGLATASVSNIAGALMAKNNKVKGDLREQIDACLTSVKLLSDSRMQARLSGASDTELKRAEEIVRACEEWSTVDLGSINSKAAQATFSSGFGAVTGLVGTAASVAANTEQVRTGEEKKEKTLNTVANVMAGGTTLASGAATVFNATQIKAIKRAATVADQCEGALK